MNRMTSIAALACSFAFFAVVSPALAQMKNPVKGIETDAQIDKAQKEEMKKQGSSGRSSTTQPAQDSPANSLSSGQPGSGKEESNIVREGVDKPPMK
jgi:hypothetical protein